MKNDIFGQAIKAYYFNKDETPIGVQSPCFEDDLIPVRHLFRSFEEMPAIEQVALQKSRGQILDVGCGAGSHSLYLQNKRHLEPVAIDISAGAIEVAKKRGLHTARQADFFALKNEKFSTILMLMNGSGIMGNLTNIPNFFTKCRELLAENGQILMDSSDLSFLAEEESKVSPAKILEELQFKLTYKNEHSPSFPWLYLSFERLKEEAQKNNFLCEFVKKGDHYDYLAKLQPKLP